MKHTKIPSLVIVFLASLMLMGLLKVPNAVRPKTWAAKIQQTSGDPVVTVIANDYVFDLTITRDATGIYSIASPQPIFIEGKVLPSISVGDAFTLQRAPKIFQFSNNPSSLKLFVTDFSGVYSDGWTLYLKLEIYP